MYQRGIESINSFYELLPTFPDKPFVTEKTIEFDVGADLPKVSITMDRIDEVDDMLDITDYKTGTVIVGQRISSDLQPPLYIKAVRDHFNRPVRRFRLIYLQEGKERVYERVDDDNYVCIVRKREYKINITESVKEVQKIFQHIKNGEFNIPNDTKSMFFTCKMCHFKENGTCRGAEEEIWYQK
jgi:RecB family exonuclease